MSGLFRNVSFRERTFRDETFCIYIRNTAEIKVSLHISFRRKLTSGTVSLMYVEDFVLSIDQLDGSRLSSYTII
jgi:hypothetical protein